MPASIATDVVSEKIEKGRLRGVVEDAERVANTALLEIRPTGDFVTYGIGVPLLGMRDPKKARCRDSTIPQGMPDFPSKFSGY